MDEAAFKQLLEKYAAGTCSGEEQTLLESWYLTEIKKKETPFEVYESLADLKTLVWQDITAQTGINDSMDQPKKTVRLWPRIAAAASIIITLAAGAYYYTHRDLTGTETLTGNIARHLPPGGNKATLTLANGETIDLSGNKTGIVINAADLTYNDGSKLKAPSEFELAGKSSSASSETLQLTEKEEITLSTPRGGQYQVKLTDGTVIWLNAASTIKFPASFAGLKQRVVVLSGEAYFEVAKVYKPVSGGTMKPSYPERIPFLVKTANQEVEVLGTHFNVNSYADESNTKTTLIEGSVNVKSWRNALYRAGFNNMTLKPGQQAINTASALRLMEKADVEEAVAWKEGKFVFNSEDLGTIMRKISRWYNIEVLFKDNVANEKFSGTISCYANLPEVLKLLELTKVVRFQVKGKTVSVTNR